MGILVNGNGTFKFEVIREFADDIAISLEQGAQLSADDVEELAQKAYEHFFRKKKEFGQLVHEFTSLDQGSWGGYGMNSGHPGLNDLFFDLLDFALSKEQLLKEIHSVINQTK